MLKSQCEAVGQQVAHFGDVIVSKERDSGGPEYEPLRCAPGEGEDAPDVRGGLFGGDALARELRIFGEGTFHVHVEFVGKIGVEEDFHHVGAHAVGVQLDGQPCGLEVAQQKRQVAIGCGLAAGNHDAVVPAFALGRELVHDVLFDAGQVRVSPGEVSVVAGGAVQVAPAHEKHEDRPAGPVGQAHGLDPADIAPAWRHAGQHMSVRLDWRLLAGHGDMKSAMCCGTGSCVLHRIYVTVLCRRQRERSEKRRETCTQTVSKQNVIVREGVRNLANL